MKLTKRYFAIHAAFAAGALALSAPFALSASSPTQGKTYVMKISLPTINDPSYFFAKAYAAALNKDSGGRIQAKVFPLSQLGSIPRQIEGTQFGSIQCVVIPPEFMVGVDPRFQVMAAPGLVGSMKQGQRLAADPAVRKLMLGLGANKGLHGIALFMNSPSSLISKTPIRRLADFKGKKIRVFASTFQEQMIERLGGTPVAMTLGDVIPALQEGTVDAAVGGVVIFAHLHFQGAAKYVTVTGQPAVYVVADVNKKWYESLPPDLRKIVDEDAAKEAVAINPRAIAIDKEASKQWLAAGGKLIHFSAAEQAKMMRIVTSVGKDVSKSSPALAKAYSIVATAAKHIH